MKTEKSKASTTSNPEQTTHQDAGQALNRAVADVLRNLRNGKSAVLPGIGTIQPGRNWQLKPERK